MDEIKKYECWLGSVPGVGAKTIEKLKQIAGDEREIYKGGRNLWKQVLTQRQLEQMEQFYKENSPEMMYKKMSEEGVRFVTKEEAAFPKRLREIPDPPYGIFVKGRLPAEDGFSVAVVGARDCSTYGEYVAKEIGMALGRNGISVISGMARGIDGISQEAALLAGGVSFGVLGSGVDVCYPKSNQKLYDQLCEQGGILSTYGLGTLAKPGNFPPRNRIVSGLADVLVVVEARKKSGTLITVDMALEQGKEVYVVPGRVTDRLSDGCNGLLKQGAQIFLSPENFFEDLKMNWNFALEMAGESSKIRGKNDDSEGLYGAVLEVLEIQEKTAEEILRCMKKPCKIADLTAILMRLCMEKKAQQKTPGSFCLACNLPEIDYNKR